MRILISIISGFIIFSSFNTYSQSNNICTELGFETGNNFQNWSGFITVESGSDGKYQGDPHTWLGTSVSNMDSDSIIFGGKDDSSRFELLYKERFIIQGDTIKDRYTNRINLVSPSGSDYIVKLGNSNNDKFSEKLSYKFIVDENTKYITYYYAMVLEDPGHDGRPYFYAETKKNGVIINCSEIKFFADSKLYSSLDSSTAGGRKVFYRNWDNNTLDFSNNVGDTIELNFISSDCNAGGHFGYAYLDLSCTNGNIDFIGEMCAKNLISFSSNATGIFQGETYLWDFGDGDTSSAEKPSHKYDSPGTYNVNLTITDTSSNNPTCAVRQVKNIVDIDICESCSECITSFSPLPGQKYLLSAWVKEPLTNVTDKFRNTGIRVKFNDGTIELPLFQPDGPIIDGWQRIEQSFTVPENASNIEIELVNLSEGTDAFFDDIRVHPFRSNMKSFVYDPSSQRLVAELDENNYATFYEYDDEGILIRVKKETERGVMTIKESRNNQSKIFK